MISFYVEEKNILPKIPYIPLLYPFFGVTINKNTPYPNEALGKYGFDRSYYQLTSVPSEADYILLPHNYWHLYGKKDDYISQLVRLAQEHHKPILIDARSDIERKVSVPGSVVLKIAQYRFNKQDKEIIVPTYVDDLLEHYCNGELTLREWKEKPQVGFAGWAELSPGTRLRTQIKELPVSIRGLFDPKYQVMHKGVLFREKAIKSLSHPPLISTKFLARPSYSGHLKTITGDSGTIRREFVENILSSDYALDVRGDANASCRFYEILSLGRIPLFIDTERIMPMEKLINYGEFCLRVDWKNLPSIGKIVSDFHARTSPEGFIEMQKRGRKVFSKMLRVDRYTPYLMEELLERTKTFSI